MRLFLLICSSLFFICNTYAQDISIRVRQVSFDAVDPDGIGPATGSVTFKIELKSSSADILADGFGLSVAYQSNHLLAAPTNTVMKLGPINTANWTQQVDNRSGNPINPVSYGGKTFDKRMIITFNQNAGVPDAVISGTSWTEVAQLTYYTLSNDYPEGGFIIPEPASVVAQNELSSDGGLSMYPFLSPEAGNPLALSVSDKPLPFYFVQFDAQCSPGGTKITWITENEKDNDYFEVQKSTDGNSWNSIERVNGSGNGSKSYQIVDYQGGAAYYRIKKVDVNGSFAFSTIVQTTCASSAYYVNLYPVPARDKLTLVVNSDKSVKTSIYVVNSFGNVVMKAPLTINKGTNNFNLDVNHLSQGMYYLHSNKDEIKLKLSFTIVR